MVNFMHEEPQIDIRGELQPERGRFNFALTLAAAALVIIVRLCISGRDVNRHRAALLQVHDFLLARPNEPTRPRSAWRILPSAARKTFYTRKSILLLVSWLIMATDRSSV